MLFRSSPIVKIDASGLEEEKTALIIIGAIVQGTKDDQVDLNQTALEYSISFMHMGYKVKTMYKPTEEEIEDIDVDDLENSRDLLDETELEDSQEN